MNTARLHRQRQPWTLVLLLAWLLFTGWGQVHRVLHLGAPGFGAAVAVSQGSLQASLPGLADEDGSSLCQLLDHLSHGPAGLTHMAIAWPGAQPLATPALHAARAPTRSPLAFEARGPPPLT